MPSTWFTAERLKFIALLAAVFALAVMVCIFGLSAQDAVMSDRSSALIVDRIISRGNKLITGIFKKVYHGAVVEPLSRKKSDPVFIRNGNYGGAKDGDFVVCEVLRYPSGRHDAEAAVREIVANSDSRGGMIKALIRASGLSEHFLPELEHDAALIANQLITRSTPL